MDQIVPRIYVGDINAAKNKNYLQRHGITHIVNAAAEIPNYYPHDFVYIDLGLRDSSMGESIGHAVQRAYHFIDGALKANGVVLVHCAAGISRSTSTVIFFLMYKFMIPYQHALQLVRSRRPVTKPNPSYEQQLIGLSRQLLHKLAGIVKEKTGKEPHLVEQPKVSPRISPRANPNVPPIVQPKASPHPMQLRSYSADDGSGPHIQYKQPYFKGLRQ